MIDDDGDSRVVTLEEFVRNHDIQTASRSDTFGGMMVSWRWISKTAATDKDGEVFFAIQDNGEIHYVSPNELLETLHLTLEDQVLAFYLPGTAPALPKHYGVWRQSPDHPDGGYWYTNEAHTESAAWKLAHHYNYHMSRGEENSGFQYMARLLPEEEWR